MVDCFTQFLLANPPDILQGAICAFISVPEFSAIFFGLVLFGVEAAIYLKTDNLTIPSVLGIIISAATFSSFATNISLPEPFLAAATLIFVVNMGVLIYGLFKG